MKKIALPLVLILLGSVPSACRSVDAGRVRVADKANEYLGSGATNDPDEAVRMAREFYAQKSAATLTWRQREQRINSDVQAAMQDQQRELDKLSATE